MSLLVLVVMVVAGISIIAVTVHMTGGTVTVRLDGTAQAIERFQSDFEGEDVSDAVLTADHENAFLWLDKGRMGIVHAFGDRFVTRIVLPHEVRSVTRNGDCDVALDLADITWRGGTFRFAEPGTADRIARSLGAANTNEAGEG